TAAYLIGHGFNYALILVANRVLNTGDFGLFYATVLALTVVLSPVIAITLVGTRIFADVHATAGRAQVARLTCRLAAVCLRWAAPAAGLLGLALVVFAHWVGSEVWPILLLFPVTVVTLALFEILRASYQGMLLFGKAGALWIVCQGAQA